ncbi:MAG: TonB family protein, partial [Alphaproteobacteria bacterium]
ARLRREGGTARLRLTVARDGTLEAVAIAASSGSPALDAASLAAARAAAPFPPAPAGLAGARHVFLLAIVYRP